MICAPLRNQKSYIVIVNDSERSSAWLEHLLWEQDVAGSNPVAPTISFITRVDQRRAIHRCSFGFWRRGIFLCLPALVSPPNAPWHHASLENPAAGPRIHMKRILE